MQPMYRRQKSVKPSRRGSKTQAGCGCGKSSCDCTCSGVCEGLQSLDRPRHFAGQLLTEAELNGTLDYVRAKNRLHNRYLHGWGVVCGLQVSCNECDGYVTVHSGYALDPCGNDILVPGEQDVPLLKMIQACRDAKRKRAAACDPVKPAGKVDCGDCEEQWCLAIRYEEQDCRPITPLRNDAARSGSSCACGSNGNGNGHGPAKAAAQRSVTPAVCEPSRVCETFRFNVIEASECCLPELPPLPRFARLDRDAMRDGRVALNRLAPAAASLGEWLVRALSCADLDNTLLGRVVTCLREIQTFVLGRAGWQSVAPLGYVLAGGKGELKYSAVQIYAAQESLYRAVVELIARNPLNVHCKIGDLLKYVPINVHQPDERGEDYAVRAAPTTYGLLALVLQYAIDCVCENLMPPCPESPCDDRVILACVTLRNDEIVSICDFGCRTYAGSFPALNYWLSAVPVVPLLKEVVKTLCCTDLLSVRDKRDQDAGNVPLDAAPGPAFRVAAETRVRPVFYNRLESLVTALDPDGTLRRTLFADNMAQPAEMLSRMAERLGGAEMFDLSALRPREGVTLNDLRDKSPNVAHAALHDAGVAVVERAAASPEELERVKLTATLAQKGDTVVLYKLGDKVAGFAHYDAEQQLLDKQAELDSLRADLDALRADVRVLKKAPARKTPPGKTSPRKTSPRKGG